MHPAKWSFKNAIHHHDRCRLVPCGTFNNAIHHHDGCRLVYTAMWDIEQFRFAFMTDAAWCISPCWLFSISIQFKMSRIDQFVYNSINHSRCNDPYQIIQVFFLIHLTKFDLVDFSRMDNFGLAKTPFLRPHRYEFIDGLNVKIRLTDKKLWP